MDYQQKSSFMPGYTGYVPHIEQTESLNKIQHSKHIPGYGGYIPNVKAENKFSESYGKVTAQSLSHTIPKGMDVPPYSRYTSSMRESFVNQRNVKIMSTAELLGVSSRQDTYKKPIPIATINKFWGIDTRKYADDESVQAQAFSQSQKNFWSFVEVNKRDFKDSKQSDFSTSIGSFWGVNKHVQELHPDLKFNPIPGYQGVNRTFVSENIFGLTYANSRKKADETLKKINEEKSTQLLKSSKFTY